MGADTTIIADCHDGAWVVRVTGPLDAHGALRLCASLSRLTHLGTLDLVVDLQSVTEADPDALAALASAGRLATRSGLGFAVVALRAIGAAATEAGLPVCEDEATAVLGATRRTIGEPPCPAPASQLPLSPTAPNATSSLSSATSTRSTAAPSP
jgi:anti-anti-sigma regulatory factor